MTLPGSANRRRLLAAALFACVAVQAQAQGLVDLIARAKPSVVAVGTYSPTDSPRFGYRGTGFVVGAGNLMVTNAHVLPDAAAEGPAKQLMVVTRPGAEPAEPRAATLIEMDRAHDLALLRFEGPALPPLPLAAPGDIREGLSVAFTGFPLGGALGFTPVTHRGIISSITAIALPSPTAQKLNEQAIRRLRQGSFDIYQLDGTAYPGNSGGPVMSVETGQVVGVINMVLVKGSKESALNLPSGISYAIPVRFVLDLLARNSGDAPRPQQ